MSSTIEGEISVCAHNVSYWYNLEEGDPEETAEMREVLEEHAEERTREMIVQGYTSGELNCLYVIEQEDWEIRGGWKIE